jgi:hypothetical protein
MATCYKVVRVTLDGRFKSSVVDTKSKELIYKVGRATLARVSSLREGLGVFAFRSLESARNFSPCSDSRILECEYDPRDVMKYKGNARTCYWFTQREATFMPKCDLPPGTLIVAKLRPVKVMQGF